MSADYIASDTEIAHEGLEIIRSYGQDVEPIKMTDLGKRLAAKFSPWREILGDRSLGKILKNEFRNKISFEGAGSLLRVRVIENGEDEVKIRFDKTVWAAFAKPIQSGYRRLFSPFKPFEFKDVPQDDFKLKTGQIEISSENIPNQDLVKVSRDKSVSSNIHVWCETNGRDVTDFIDSSYRNEQPRQIRRTLNNMISEQIAQNASGITALKQLIAAIPPEERKNYNFPLDLLHRLLSLK